MDQDIGTIEMANLEGAVLSICPKLSRMRSGIRGPWLALLRSGHSIRNVRVLPSTIT
jgi:hypothetical protein